MKKTLLTLAALLCAVLGFAQEVTFDFNDSQTLFGLPGESKNGDTSRDITK